MPKYSKDQRAKILESYFSHKGSLVAVQRNFVRIFQQRPFKHSIISMISRFRDFVSTTDKERSGRPRSVRNACVIQRVWLGVPCPSRSLDLTPQHFFLWRYLKGKVYINMHNTLHELKNNIIDEIKRITPNILEKVMENTVCRIHLCLNNNGEHLKDIIFK